jgi:hypothetical protein
MLFLSMCVLLWALFALKTPFDQYGWLMIVGLTYVAGFLDSRLFARFDQDKARTLPPDAGPEDVLMADASAASTVPAQPISGS